MTSPTALLRPSRASEPSRLLDTLRWAAIVLVASAATGVLAGFKPALLVAITGLAAAASAFVYWPAAVLIAVVLVRASLDKTDATISVAGNSLSFATAAAVGLGGGLALLIAGPRLPAKRVIVPFSVMLVIAAFSLTYTLVPDQGAKAWLNVLSLLVIFMVALWVVRGKRDLDRLTAACMIGAVVPIGWGLWQLATGNMARRTGFDALDGSFLFPNGYAFFLLIVLSLGLVLFFESRGGWERAALGALLAVGGLCFFLTYTRSAWVAGIVVLALLGLFQYRKVVVAGVIGLVLVVLLAPSTVETVQDRFSDLSQTSQRYSESSLNWRLTNWTTMGPYASEKPITGHGFGSYAPLTFEAFGRYTRNFQRIDDPSDGIFAHNDYLSLAVEIGYIGAAAWLLALLGLATLMWQARRVPQVRPYATLMFALVIVFIVLSAVDNVQSYTGALYYLLALCGAVAGVAHRYRSRGADAAGDAGEPAAAAAR